MNMSRYFQVCMCLLCHIREAAKLAAQRSQKLKKDARNQQSQPWFGARMMRFYNIQRKGWFLVEFCRTFATQISFTSWNCLRNLQFWSADMEYHCNVCCKKTVVFFAWRHSLFHISSNICTFIPLFWVVWDFDTFYDLPRKARTVMVEIPSSTLGVIRGKLPWKMPVA